MSERPPQVNEVLIKILKTWHSRGKRSAHVPANPFDSAQWWIDIQEPADEYRDRPEPTMNKNGEQCGWITPYHDRIAHNLRKFLAMSETNKAFVIDRIRAGIPYRGDDIEFYKMICVETEKMKINPDKYIQEAKVTARGFLNH